MKSRHCITLALLGLATYTQAQIIQRIDGPVVSAGEPQIINLSNDLNNWIEMNPTGNGTPLNEPGATGTYYFGFDWTINNNTGENGGGGFYAGLWFFENNDERPAFGNGWASVGYQIAGPGGDVDVAPPTPYTLGQTVRIVGKIEFVADADDIVSMWVNPVLLTDESGQAGVPTVTLSRNMEFNNIRARSGNGSAQTTFAEILVASTFQGASTKDLSYDADTDSDGIKDGWERLYPGVMVVGINDAAGNPDNDGLTNLQEFERDTNPGDADTDDDTLSDGQEVNVLMTNPKSIDTDSDGVRDDYETNTGDYVSPTNAGTSPLVADTDGDTHSDGFEISLNSDPTDANSVPNGGNLALIGSDPISYANGPIDNASGGSGFDFDNTADGNSFIGHTGVPSDWDNDFGNPQVSNGKVITQESGARREFNSDERAGRVNDDGPAQVVYLSADVTIGADVTYTALSSFDFGSEKVFAGVPTAANPVSGKKEFALTGPGLDGGALEYTGIEAVVGQTYTLVVKVDYVADLASIFVNPNLAGGEPTPLKTAPWTSGNWTTALRVASGGIGTVAWDNIVAAREWAGLNAFPTGTTTTYAAWIAGFPQVGALTGVNDDFDQDGLKNGIEQVLGTSPAAFNQGLVQVSSAGTSVVFSHSRTNIPATDIASSYEWSTNLQNWFASGATAPGGLAVLITNQTTADLTAPANDTITVTATPTSGATSKLFVRLKATSGF